MTTARGGTVVTPGEAGAFAAAGRLNRAAASLPFSDVNCISLSVPVSNAVLTAGGVVVMCRILVVEDTQIVREPLSRLLRSEGFTVIPAADGSEAMAAL